MNKEINKRILTSIILFIFVIIMVLNNMFLIFIVLISCVISFIEFSKINLIINNNKYLQLINNLLFIFYLSSIFFIFLISTVNFNFKIFIFTTLLICISSDIGGFIFGKLFKGPKLSIISPKKTIAGCLGSFISSIIISSSIYYYFENEFFFYPIFFGLLVSLGVQIGDLFFSFLKRKSKLKDTGNLLPGHGGILDRVDGILLGLPFGLIFSIIIN